MTPLVHPLRDDALANTSYLVEIDDGEALVIDPPRDVDAHLALAERLGVEIVTTLDTHVHADYVSGAREFAARGAEAVVPRGACPQWPQRSIADDERLTLGRVVVHALATPGHTPEHLAYLVEVDGAPVAVFTGGSLILGGAARTDLLGADQTEALARAQFRSLRRLAELPDSVALHPTHGAGSFCLAVATTVANPTIGSERATNPLLAIDDEDAFVDALVAGFGTFPTYYRHLQDVNRAGAPLLGSLGEPERITAPEAARRVEQGAWLVDARPFATWAAEHPVGAVSDELRPAFASWLGWVVPFGASVVLLVEPERLDEALRLAHRIGYDDLAVLDGGLAAWKAAGLAVARTEQVDADTAAQRQREGAVLLDVRQRAELDTLSIPGAIHLELGDIATGAVPDAIDVIAFCGHGERSATAASLLEARGVRVANLTGGTAAWAEAGLPVEP